ncbi:MAG TPA: methylmalonyl Co-A mutase-associated GTPase MeaB [Flavobacteriales bacterium]|nr:methylmalonyl Co-A mutase-associated GTPase MeaB [Flavobacteriales bacterium]
MQSGKRNSIRQFLDKKADRFSLEELLSGIQQGNRRALSKAITLTESTRKADRELANAILKSHQENSTTRRIGITGIPGVGKSTFIERLGIDLINRGHKVAVLAVDPSSPEVGGSILGDKMRMPKLAANREAFIRPSPSSGALGGVGNATRESIALCEMAGFDIILVETVGVGQSEVTVHGMVDVFLLLMLAGAGDEVQGIKRGIIEMADLILINKADGNNLKNAQMAAGKYQSALHLFPQEGFWTPSVLTCSALSGRGFDELLDMINKYFDRAISTSKLNEKRTLQQVHWYRQLVKNEVINAFFFKEENKVRYTELEGLVAQRKLTPLEACFKAV